jgi:hypothetical protein
MHPLWSLLVPYEREYIYRYGNMSPRREKAIASVASPRPEEPDPVG